MIAAAYLAALCMIGCTYEGYDSGKYVKPKCQCVDEFEPSDFTLKKVKRAKMKTKEENE